MLAKRLKELREEKGYSFRVLSALCGVSKSAIVLYEQGKRNPKREVVEAFADIFNVDVDYLMGKSDIRSVYADQIHNTQKQTSPTEPKLTEGEEMLLELFRRIPEDKQTFVLHMIRAALENQQ